MTTVKVRFYRESCSIYLLEILPNVAAIGSGPMMDGESRSEVEQGFPESSRQEG